MGSGRDAGCEGSGGGVSEAASDAECTVRAGASARSVSRQEHEQLSPKKRAGGGCAKEGAGEARGRLPMVPPECQRSSHGNTHNL